MLKLVIVGSGWWGSELARAAHAEARRTPARITLGGVCSLQIAQAEALCTQLGGRSYADYAAVLADTSVHAVVLATPHSLHTEQIIACAQAGKAVFCEKPLALKAADAKRSVEACQAAGVLLGIGTNKRFWPCMRVLRRVVDRTTLPIEND